MGNIVALGIVSMLIDLSTEMVYPIIPLYLTAVMGTTPAIVGVIEGIAESLASVLKVFSGYWTDKHQNKKAFTFVGYSGSIVYKLALLLATSWTGILGARVIDRVGKGIRTAPRDSLIAESSKKNAMGASFGLHKTLDMLGSALGILAAYFLMAGAEIDYKRIFMLSIIPAIIGVIAINFVKESKNHEAKKGKFEFSFKLLDSKLKRFLVISALFTLGNSSNAFLLLRAQNSGFTPRNVVLLYFLFNIVASAFAYPLGKLSDKIGRRALLVGAYLAYGIVYIGFAFVSSKAGMVALFAIYGLYSAMGAGAERALLAEIAPAHLKGTVLGMQSTIVGIALLPASVIAGFLWSGFGVQAPFLFGGSLAIIAAVAVFVLLKKEVAQ